ncbi:efflux RND transporter periplasmic adaptor subunit [Anaeroselena agilis]|uniref:Efflux RND transporter periplasmic adaptor subunit n=1 Tax=Anaeroselena agilis TaxID=3063788 RepID=A0ABU3NZC6_9FIRM|nr:efflux RND transporter periplasmic adaptor subunit [Selenomonadales bacterium 4137-cl]
MATDKKKLVKIVAIVVIAFTAVIAYRIYANLAANKERAGRVTQGRTVAVELGKVTRQDIKPVLVFSANLEPVWSADISSKVDGRIDRLLVEEGDVVKAGSLLAVLDTNELAAQVVQAQGSLFSAQASLEQANLDLKRTEALAKQGAVSVQALDTARIKRDLAIGSLRSAEGNLALLQARLDNANIVAPRDGVVVKRYVQAGYYTKAGTAIVAVADTASLLAKAMVGEAQVHELSVGSKVAVQVNAFPGKQFAGTVTRISPAAVQPSRTFTAEITIPNPGGQLKSGMFAKVEAPGRVRPGALAVPEGALVMREDQKTVFVVIADNKVQQRLLKLGYVGGGWAEVLDGVKLGDTIVVAGHNKLKDGSSIAPSPGAGEK